MPTHRDISLTLQSQYDAHTIPEYINSPPNSSGEAHQVNVSIPTLPSSQFWLTYTCPPPPPESPFSHYYFKLFISGVCAVSWGSGANEEWRGKMMFGLFDGGTDFEGRRVVEKRGLFFPGAAAGGGGFEVRVFRARGRVRVREAGGGVWKGGEGEGVDLTTIGRKRVGERQRFYTYALLDAKDEPFVTFRYTFCTSEQLRNSSQDEEVYDATPAPEPARRVSLPPRTRLTSRVSRTESSSPLKSDPSRSGTEIARTSYDSEHVDRRHGSRTPPPADLSPSPDTPPSQRKAPAGERLRSVVAGALKRRGAKGMSF